jgi:hypothetical protein
MNFVETYRLAGNRAAAALGILTLSANPVRSEAMGLYYNLLE